MGLIPVSLRLVVSSCVCVVMHVVMGGSVSIVVVVVVDGGVCNMSLSVVRSNSVNLLMVVVVVDERNILVRNGSVVLSDGLAVLDTLVVNGLDVVDDIVRGNNLVVDGVLVGAEIVTAVGIDMSMGGSVMGVVRLILKIVVRLVTEVIIIIMATIAVVAMGVGITSMRPAAVDGDVVVVVSVVLLVAGSLVDTVGVSGPVILVAIVASTVVRVSGAVLFTVVVSGTVVVVTSVPGIGVTVAVADTVTVAVAVTMALTVSITVNITVAVTMAVAMAVTVALRVTITVVGIIPTVALVVVGSGGVDIAVGGVVVVMNNGDVGHGVVSVGSVKRSVGNFVAHNRLVPAGSRSDLSVVVSIEVDGGVGVVGSVVTAGLPVLLGDVSNSVAVKRGHITVAGVLGPSVLAKNVTLSMAEAVSVVANTVAVVTTMALEGVVVTQAAAILVTVVRVSDVSDTSIVLVRSTNSLTEVFVSARAAEVLSRGHRVMGTVVEIGTIVLMNGAVVVALVVAGSVLIVGLDVETAVVSLVPVLAVLPGGSNGSNHADGEGLHVRVDG